MNSPALGRSMCPACARMESAGVAPFPGAGGRAASGKERLLRRFQAHAPGHCGASFSDLGCFLYKTRTGESQPIQDYGRLPGVLFREATCACSGGACPGSCTWGVVPTARRPSRGEKLRHALWRRGEVWRGFLFFCSRLLRAERASASQCGQQDLCLNVGCSAPQGGST